MKHSFLLLLLLGVASIASAEKIKCTFTEPFVSLTYDSDENQLTLEALGEFPQCLKASVLFEKDGMLKVSDKGKLYNLEINTSKEGSDGMSDFRYPFYAVLNGKYSNLHGGCETDHLKKAE